MKRAYPVLILVISLFFLCGYVDLREGANREGRMLLARRTIAGIIAQNDMNISKLSLGMTKDEVLAIMENKPLIAYQNGVQISVTSPSKEETLQGKENKINVLYYITQSYDGDYSVIDRNLTPIVFENDKLIGIGWDFLDDIMEKYEIERK